MNIFNIIKTKIPTGETKEIKEVESYTVNWSFSDFWNRSIEKFKVFTSKEDAEEFVKQLYNASNLIGNSINTKISKN